MTEADIIKDRQERTSAAKAEIDVILQKYELTIIAEEVLSEFAKIILTPQLVDLKKYPDAELAQPEKSTEPLNQPEQTNEGVQVDGGLVINPESLK